MDHSQHGPSEKQPRKLFRARWVLIGFAAIAAYFLFMEHRAHLSGLAYYLPFVLLLACPLMHIFMHGGHGGHGGSGNDTRAHGHTQDPQKENRP